jgi:exodeoxyribonuclease V alpha subunit
MEIKGVLNKVYFSNDSHWGVYNVSCKDKSGKESKNSFAGVLHNPVVGQTYLFEGKWEQTDKYGEQFKFFSYREDTKSAEGAFALLSSSRFKGIGPKKAQAIIDKFGDDTLDVIKNNPEKLVEVSGITAKTVKTISESMPNIGIWEELRMLLKGATENAVNKLYEKYKDDVISVIKKNPYVLIDEVDGYGFIKADAIARDVGITGSHPLRVKAAIFHCLETAAEQGGHCFSYANNLQINLQELIPGVEIDVVADCLKELTNPSYGRMRVHIDPDGAVYLNSYWNAECTVAYKVRQAIERESKIHFSEDAVKIAVDKVASKTGIRLDEFQQEAVLKALNYPLCVITGGPGTGKTTIIKTIIEAIKAVPTMKYGKPGHPSIALMAPTGRAARRMYEATGSEAYTIHSRLLGSELIEDYIIVDETSMVDILLASKLLKAIKVQQSNIIFIGDIDQLPPIGAGVFFRDLINSYKVPTIKLKTSFRQNGSIAANAIKMNMGVGPHAYICDEYFSFTQAQKEQAASIAKQAYLNLIEKYGVKDTVLLSPTRQRGNGCTNTLNIELQALINPHISTERVFKSGPFTIGINDRVMLTKNKIIEGHANGDVGTITNITKNYIEVLFDTDAKPIVCENEVRPYFTLAYAMTIHKSQGSEYAGVVVLFSTEHQFMGERALLYTGVTRAKTELHLVGDSRAISLAVAKVKPITRNSKLMQRINE